MPIERNEGLVPGRADAYEASGTDSGTAGGTEQVELTSEQMEHWARLLADGEVEFPDDLPVQQADALAAATRRRRRDRFVKLIARQIALFLKSDLEPDQLE